jgi:polar amino acid transport system substrate-binding protein
MRLITALFTALLALTPLAAPAAEASARESAYDRVMRTNTLRCGYLTWPDFFEKDVNTGAYSGFWYDYVEMLAASLNLKVEWTAEIPYPDVGAALSTGKVDAYCMAITPLPARLRSATFTQPVVYVPINIYARANDARLIGHPEHVGDPETRIVSVEGEAASLFARQNYPHAKLTELQTLTGADQVFQDIISGKGDVTFTVPLTFSAFDANNPGKLALVTDKPLGVLGGSMAVPLGEHLLADLFNLATSDLYNNGKLQALIRQHHMAGQLLVRAEPSAPLTP